MTPTLLKRAKGGGIQSTQKFSPTAPHWIKGFSQHEKKVGSRVLKHAHFQAHIYK